MHCGNVGLLLWRKHLIEAEPPPPTITVEKNDFTTMMYWYIVYKYKINKKFSI